MANQMIQNNKIILVKKASGDEEPFIVDKLEHSLRNAGAGKKAVERIVADIERWIYSGVTTKKIYSRAFSLLRREKNNVALRYKLKQAILELGPTGYPFEHLIGKLFERQGFSIEVGVIIPGNCVTHEMDVIATRDNIQYLVECKYSKDQGKQVSVQVPLYVRSRVDDIIKKRKELPENHDVSFSGWVVTNTRFSADSIQYGKCSGLSLLAWDYPNGYALKDIIEKEKIYPITLLNHITKNDKEYLMGRGIVTCFQLAQSADQIKHIDMSEKKFNALMKELEDICG